MVKLRDGKNSTADKFVAFAANHGVQLQPTPKTGAASETYLTAEVSASYEDAARIAETLSHHPDVEASYVKPTDALPGG
jgi:hypothetical protein